MGKSGRIGWSGLLALALAWVLVRSAGAFDYPEYPSSVTDRPQPRDKVVLTWATIDNDAPSITIYWPTTHEETEYGTGYTITRQVVGSGGPSTIFSVSGPAAKTTFSYTDTTLTPGVLYQYTISGTIYLVSKGSSYTGSTTFYGGVKLPVTEDRGKIILVLDKTMSSPLAGDIQLWKQDLICDGWQVLTEEVDRDPDNPDDFTACVPVRSKIKAQYNSDPANVKAAALFGHIPVPYSGTGAFDGHTQHAGAWSTDTYYADLDGVWTDTSVDLTMAGTDYPLTEKLKNIPGDGKFDQSSTPTSTEIMVGRIDMAAMTAFKRGSSDTDYETRLLKNYLRKDHAWRHKQVTVKTQGLVQDGFRNYVPSSWQGGFCNLVPLVGGCNVVEGNYPMHPILDLGQMHKSLESDTWLWLYGTGGGGYTGASTCGDSWDWAELHTNVVFTMLFGSYFGDWDQSNAYLRAPLASDDYTLTCAWGDRPVPSYTKMGYGEVAAYWYYKNSFAITANFFGDPTLRMGQVAPPTNLNITTSNGAVEVTWDASPDADMGYYVYHSTSAEGPFTRVTPSPITHRYYIDLPANGPHYYMVKALSLFTGNTVSYYNLSQGVLGYVYVSLSDAPEIEVTGNDQRILTGDTLPSLADHTSFGDVSLSGGTMQRSYTISNVGRVDLNLTGSPRVEITGPQASEFTILATPPATLSALGGSAALVISFTPGGLGLRQATVSIATDDADENPFVFAIHGRGVNNTPVVFDQSLTTPEDTPLAITLTASDADGDALGYLLVTAPKHGTLTGTAPNWVYTPAADFSGDDRFTFKATDGFEESSLATVSIIVTPVDDPLVLLSGPTASPNPVATGQPANLEVVATDSDTTTGISYLWELVSGPGTATFANASAANTTVICSAAGTYVLRLTATSDGVSVSGTVTLEATSGNHTPVITLAPTATLVSRSATLKMAASDTDLGDVLTYSWTLVSGAGSVIFTPGDLPEGLVSFSAPGAYTLRVTVSDGQASVSGTVSVTVVAAATAATMKAESYMGGIYQRFLARQPDEAGLAGWSDALIAGTYSAVYTARNFVLSREHTSRATTNAVYADALYRGLLARAPDSGGYNQVLTNLNSGALREDQMTALLFTDEFRSRCTTLGIVHSTSSDERRRQIRGFVRRFYIQCLVREPDGTGMDFWSGSLSGGTKTGADVARGFALAQEFTNRNLSDSAFLDVLYSAFFDRSADAGGKAYWQAQLAAGATRAEVLEGFIGAAEFAALCTQYSIKAF